MRRLLLLLVACAALAVPLAGCGSSKSSSVSSTSSSSHRVVNAGVCAYSVWRGTHDARTHHFVFAAFQTWLAVHHCPKALHK
jgi:hypothetical protein